MSFRPHSAVDPPTGLSAVHDITSTQAYSIAVSWTPSLSPPSTIYGYRIYYQLGGAEESVVVTGSDVASYNLTVMYWARHRIRMQTLSESRLPSELTATIHSTGRGVQRCKHMVGKCMVIACLISSFGIEQCNESSHVIYLSV